MSNFTQAEIDDMVAGHESRQRAHDEALLDDMDSGRQIDLMLTEAQGQTEDSFFEPWDEMSFQEKYEYASFTCPGFSPLAVVHDIDESAHRRTCPDRAACCRCSGCEGGIPCAHWAPEAVAEHERREAEQAADRERWEAEEQRADAEIEDLRRRLAEAVAKRDAAQLGVEGAR